MICIWLKKRATQWQNNTENSLTNHTTSLFRVATVMEKVMEKIFFQYHGKIREFCSQSVKMGNFEEVRENQNKTRSTQRAQTSLAEADHYSHIAHCKNVEPWL